MANIVEFVHMNELQHTQNFIRDAKTVKSLLKKTDITSKDIVLDIGAGDGLIAAELSKVARSVIAIELDPQSVQNLQISFANSENVTILAQDFFQYPLPQGKYKVFSNPPFDRTADIVRRFLDAANPPESIYLFMQQEAAERFTGQPKMTQISAIYYPEYEVKVASKVHRSVFVPIPNVDVVLASLTKRKRSLITAQSLSIYRDFIAYSFNQWQPTILDSLKRIFTNEQKKKIRKSLKIDKQKPSDLSHAELIGLFETFMKYVPAQTKEIVKNSYSKQEERNQQIIKLHRTRI